MQDNQAHFDGEEKQLLTLSEYHEITKTRYNNSTVEPLQIACKIIEDDITIGNPQIVSYGGAIQDLNFENCFFDGELNVQAFSAGKVILTDCVFNKPVHINYSQVSLEGSCKFNSHLTISLENRLREAQIKNLNVKGKLTITGSVKSLKIEKINLEQRIENQEIIISADCNELNLNNACSHLFCMSSHIEFGAAYLDKMQVNTIDINYIVLNGVLNIRRSKIDEIAILNLKGSKRTLSVIETVINKAIVHIETLKNLSFALSKIEYLELSGSNDKESVFEIEKSHIRDLSFSGVYNNGTIALRELKTELDGKISFRSSNLGKTEFIYCDFSKGILEFENCKIIEAFFSETEFPKMVHVNGKNNYGQAQLVFGQLAAAFQKQGDTIRALEYTSRELEAHYKILRWRSSNFFQKLNLWLNSISNDFGRNWIRGCIFTFGVGLLFFCLLLISTPNYKMGMPSFDFNLLPAYLKFMNPLRFFELEHLFINTPKEKTISLNSISYLADYGGRIFIAYGYYQTIQAFRRFGRK